MPADTHAQPVLNESIDEVQGIFPDDDALQTAIGNLTRAGFDRAQISLPAASPAAEHATPEKGAADPMTMDDQRQARTLGSSTAAAAGAMIGAGVTVATGGAAGLAIAAAAGLGALSGGAALAASSAVGNAAADGRAEAAAHGQLVLAVSVHGPESTALAEVAMRDAGASRVEAVTRAGGGLN